MTPFKRRFPTRENSSLHVSHHNAAYRMCFRSGCVSLALISVSTVLFIASMMSTVTAQSNHSIVAPAVNASVSRFSRRVVYSRAKLNTTYSSSASFDPRGMEFLYLIANMFLDVIQPDNTTPALDPQQLEAARKAGNLTDTVVHLGLFEWPRLVRHHPGFAALGVLGLMVSALLPLIGLIVCGCRCGGRCGGQADEYDKRCDSCRRVFLGVLLSVFVIALLFGVVASFFVNEYMERGVHNAPRRLHGAIDDVQLYLENTDREVVHLLINNYDELKGTVNLWLDGCGDRVRQRLANVSQAAAVQDLATIAGGLHHIRTDLSTIVDLTGRVQELAAQLEVGLQDVQQELSQLLELCNTLGCVELVNLYNISHLAVLNQFARIPDVRATAQEVSNLIDNGIDKEVESGQRAFEQLSEKIQSEVDVVVPRVRRSMDEAGIRLRQVAGNVSVLLDSVEVRPAHSYVKTAGHFLENYGRFRYYMFFIVSGLLVLIVFCLVIGLFCGLCGRRPGDVFGDDTCNRGTGANFLLSGVFFYFLFGWLLFLLTTCLFLVGGLTQFYVCDGLANPDSPSRSLALLQSAFDFDHLFAEMKLSNLSLSRIVVKCHRNESIYSVFNLASAYNLSGVLELKNKMNIEEQLESLQRQIRVNTNVAILSNRGKEQLNRFANSKIATINYTAFTDAIQGSITSFDLASVAVALEGVADELSTSQRASAVRIRNQAIILRAQQRVVDNISALVTDLGTAIASLQFHAKFNHSSVTEAVLRLVARAENAQEYLRTRGNQELVELASEYVEDLTLIFDGYVAHVNQSINAELGRCGPLSNAYNATSVTLCNNMVYPLNGFWTAVGWCLLLLVPCIALSLRLTPLYRKSEPFSGALLEEEHYSSCANQSRTRGGGGGASNGGAGGRHRRSSSNNHHRHRALDNSGHHSNYRSESPPYVAIPPRGQEINLHPLGASQLRVDTDPKAPPLWELHGGPPGYNDVSDDFERPPPYFFPGPAQ